MSKAVNKPGTIVQDSGIVEERGPRGGKTDNRATVVEGEPFPPTTRKGSSWQYVKKTHK